MRRIVSPVLLLAAVTGCASEYHYDYHPETTYSYAQNVTVEPPPAAPARREPHDTEPAPDEPLTAVASGSVPIESGHREEPRVMSARRKSRDEHRAPSIVGAKVSATAAQLAPVFVADDRPSP